MKKYDKLIFVGKANTARTVMAEAIAQKAFELEDILIESRGLVVLFPEPVNPKAEAVLISNGLTMKEHESRALSKDDFDARTLILTMSPEQKEAILKDYSNAVNVYTLCEYAGLEEDLADPYGGPVTDYGRCFEQLRKIVGELGSKLIEEDR